jgi:hypothetical protein
MFIIIITILKCGIINQEYETYISLEEYNLPEETEFSSFTGTNKGNVEIINSKSVKLNGRKKGKYTFTVIDKNDKEYEFEYHYDKKEKTVVLNKK